MIKLIFASTPKGIIGKDGNLPWPPLKGELKRFKELTTGSIVVMGRTTFNSLPKGPLPDRYNFVLTNNLTLSDRLKSVIFNFKNRKTKTRLKFGTFKTIYDEYMNKYSEDMFIIGGGSIYRQYESYCDEMIWTKVETYYPGDTLFVPRFDMWELKDEEKYDEYSILFFHKNYAKKIYKK